MNKFRFKSSPLGPIPEDWEVHELQDVVDNIIDYRGKTPKKTNQGIPLVTAKIVKMGSIDYANLEYISEDDYGAWMRRGIPKAGDVVVTTEAPLGEVAQLPKFKIALAQRIITLRGGKDVLDNTFLKYYFLSSIGGNQLKSRETGSVVTGIKQSELRRIKVLLPPLPTQRRIAEILSSLDDKIELNRKMNKTLESIAQAIFKRWFVDFEFPDKNGEPYKSNGGKMVESELGEVPEGWGVGAFGEAVNILDSKRIPLSKKQREQRQGHYPYYGATSIMDYVDDYLFDGVYVLLGEDGSVVREDGSPFVQYVYGKIWVNNHAHVLEGKNGFSTEFVKLLLNQTEITPYVTGAVQPKLNQENMKTIPLVIPSQKILDEFNGFVQPIYKQIIDMEEQSRKLSQIRDSLLPRLMSGRVRV